MLNEIRERLDIKLKECSNKTLENPEVADEYNFISELTKFYSDGDMISQAPLSFIKTSLFYLGYSLPEIKEMYPKLLEEANKKYTLIEPEQLDEIIRNGK